MLIESWSRATQFVFGMWFSNEYAALTSAFSFVPYYMLLLLSSVIFLSLVDPAKATQEFTVYRLTQFDHLKAQFGK